MPEKEHGKELAPQKERETIDKAAESSRIYMNRLIVVAIAANELVEAAKKSDRYYIRVTRQRFNTLKLALEALGKLR